MSRTSPGRVFGRGAGHGDSARDSGPVTRGRGALRAAAALPLVLGAALLYLHLSAEDGAPVRNVDLSVGGSSARGDARPENPASFSLELLIDQRAPRCSVKQNTAQGALSMSYLAVARAASGTMSGHMRKTQKSLRGTNFTVLTHHSHDCVLRDLEERGVRRIMVVLRHPLARISSGIQRRFEGNNANMESNALVREHFKARGPDAFVTALRDGADPLHDVAMAAAIGPGKQSHLMPVSEFYLGSPGEAGAEVSFLCIDTLERDYASTLRRWGAPVAADLASASGPNHTSEVSSGVAADVPGRFSDATIDWVERTYAGDVALYEKHCPESAREYSRPSTPARAQVVVP